MSNSRQSTQAHVATSLLDVPIVPGAVVGAASPEPWQRKRTLAGHRATSGLGGVLSTRLTAAVILAIAAGTFSGLVAGQAPGVWPDSTVYLETAAQPLSAVHVLYPKPLLVPLLYRMVGAEVGTILAFQKAAAFLAWSLLAATLWVSLRPRVEAVLAAAVAMGFLFSPLRLGWTTAVLSESINDSLMALLLASVLAARLLAIRDSAGGRRWMLPVGLGFVSLLAAAWVTCRDTNAAVVAVAAVFVVGCSSWRRGGRARRWVMLAALSLGVMGLLAARSAQVVAPSQMGLSLNAAWSPELTARGTFSLLNNLFVRVLPDSEAVAFCRSRGMPWSPELQSYAGKWAFVGDYEFLKDQSFRPVHAWIAQRGASTWALWLLRHPLARAAEVARESWSVLTSPKLPKYMPPGWTGSGIRLPWLLVIGLLPLAAVGAVKSWRTFLGKVAVGLTVSGGAGWVVAYYGDALEVPRHCYGSGQQILLGLCLCVVAWAAEAREWGRS